ncbi:IS66 family insertion sequence element accessory protein TnpB [Ferrimonas balearica]|nr:IS66 family insertion sequence element accessory protein TnpB [Ferrimonas balearica]
MATKPVGFRKGHDGLTALVQSILAEDPFTGTVFVFRSKRADRLKILFWDGSGLVMAYKRLEQLVAERNHVVHGKRSEKLSEDDRQLAFEDLEPPSRECARVSDLLCMSDPVHASSKGSTHDDL